MITKTKLLLLMLLAALLTGCVTARPHNIQNICSIFYQYPKWYWDAKKSQKKWGVPVYVQMAIIYQESHFNAKAKPPREHLLGFIPWFRPTSAYGYSQSIKSTWKRYERETGDHGSRHSFAAATDFIGWFGYQAHIHARVSRNNAYALYLAYHEGINGYLHHTYWNKTWLIHVAHKVAYHARIYQRQLRGCASKIKKHHWWDL